MNATEYRLAIIESLKEIAPEANYDRIDDDADLRDQLDLDSMDILNLAIGINARTGVDVPERDYSRIATITGAVGYLMKHGQSGESQTAKRG